jgi:hypothetical protein
VTGAVIGLGRPGAITRVKVHMVEAAAAPRLAERPTVSRLVLRQHFEAQRAAARAERQVADAFRRGRPGGADANSARPPGGSRHGGKVDTAQMAGR